MKRCLRILVLSVIFGCLIFALMQTAAAAGTLVTVDNVNFRKGPSLDASVITTVKSGSSVEVLEHDPAGWSKVKVNGTTGYIRSDFLGISSGSKGVTFKTTDGVNFRTGASLDAKVITTLTNGTSVEMIEHNPAGWSKVKVNGTTGYIRSDFLALTIQSTQQTSSTPVQNTQQETSAPAQSVQQDTSTSATEPTKLKTNADVNLRSEPSTDARIIRTLDANTEVDVIEYDSSGWTKASVEGSVGYIRSDLLSMSGRNVELLEWSAVKGILKNGVPLHVYDVRSGVSFNIQCFSKGDHADVEPVTKEDTDTIFRIRNNVWSWAARPVWVTIGDRTVAASINGMPHDVTTIRDNGLNGHFCLHFKGSTTSSSSASYKADLQNAVTEAWNAR